MSKHVKVNPPAIIVYIGSQYLGSLLGNVIGIIIIVLGFSLIEQYNCPNYQNPY